jgi:hypothetical protein
MQSLAVPPPLHLERDTRVNWSTLRLICTSPRHYINNLSTPRADTDALLLGRLTHCAVLEPDRLATAYVVSPRFNKTMKNENAILKGYDGGREAAERFEEENADREIVTLEMMSQARAMRNAVLSDPVASPYVLSGLAEQRIEWVDAETGIECCGRVDYLNAGLTDLKTTRAIVSCERDSARFGYHSEVAWYSDGLRAAGHLVVRPPALVFVESVPPYDVLVLTFDEDDLAVGRRVYRAALARLAECRSTGKWPGIGGGVSRRIQLPAWADPIQDDMELVVDGQAVKV